MSAAVEHRAFRAFRAFRERSALWAHAVRTESLASASNAEAESTTKELK